MPLLEQLARVPAEMSGVLWAALALRALWLLPDWVAKWRRAEDPSGVAAEPGSAPE